MKRVTMILICLVMCFSMAFPASAQVIMEETSLISSAKIAVHDANSVSYVPSDYNYKVVVISGSSPMVFYTNTPTMTTSTIFYFTGYPTTREFITQSITYNASTGEINWTVKPRTGTTPAASTLYVKGVITNYSTATIPNQSSLFATGLANGKDFDIYLVPKIDVSALQTLLTTAKAKQNNGYTSASWQALQTAITAADNLMTKAGYTQAQVDEAKNNLQSALDGLTLLPDTSALLALLNQAKSVTNDGYNTTTWQALQSAISSAQSLLNGTDYTATQVESARSKLQSALNGLEYLPPVDELKELLVEADAIEDIGYTQPTWNRFDTARYNGHVLVARTNYTSYEVASTTTELRVSMNALTLTSIDPPVIPVDPYQSTYFDSMLESKRAETYLDIADGFSLDHLFPAIAGIKENYGEARNFGIWVFVAMIVVLITTKIIRSMLGIESVDASGSHESVFNIGMNAEKRSVLASKNDMSRKDKVLYGSEYHGATLGQVKTGEKYIDW